MSATTPVKLAAVGAVPPRDGGLSGGIAPSVVEVFPGVFLLATIVRRKNQCIFELVQPTNNTASTSHTGPSQASSAVDNGASSSSNSSNVNSAAINTGGLRSTPQITPSFTSSTSLSSSSPKAEEVVQRRLSEQDGIPRRQAGPVSPTAAATATGSNSPTVVVPMALKSGFRVPRVIQLVAEDEGVIETVTLVREPLGTAFVAALEEQDRAASKNPLRATSNTNSNNNSNSNSNTFAGASAASGGAAGAALGASGLTGSGVFTGSAATASIPSVNHVHIHFFIGTSNGTVIVGNALRGTILAVAQFQYHHLFTSELRGTRVSTTATSPTSKKADGSGGSGAGGDAGSSTQGESKASDKNQAVVKFVVREKREEQLWNPSLPFTQENLILTSQDIAGASKKSSSSSSAAIAASPTLGSRIASVYVVHSGGKVVELTRAALDVFVRSSVDRLDGRRPHLILEWEPETSPSSFPVAGPASDFAAHLGSVFVLEPPTAFSAAERRTATAKAATPESTHVSIRDADIVTEMPENAAGALAGLLAPLNAQRRPCESLLVGGSSPLFAFYRLQPPSSGFSASNAVKAVKNIVTGVARTLWFSALGTTNPAERPPHLKKISTPGGRPFLQADAKCAALQVDPSQQWAAFIVEGGGRIYIADVQSGVVSGVLKGCRAAQFTWWWTDTAAGRPALLLVVYLPLRRAVEVYTARSWERLAACHVPEGCVLLRACGVPREKRSTTSISSSNSISSSSKPVTTTCSGCGSGALLMDPAGTVYEIQIGWRLASTVNPTAYRTSMSPLSADDAGTQSNEVNGESGDYCLLDASLLRGCRTPDDFVELALQLPLPQPHVTLDDCGKSGSSTPDLDAASSTTPAAPLYAVHGGDEVRRYGKSLDLLCSTVQRRFAPGYAEIVVTPLPCSPQQVLEGSLASVPRNMTAAQCLHYVRLYQSLTENYYRLLSCRRFPASRYFDPAQWTSGLVTAALWSANFSTATSASGSSDRGGAAPSPTLAFVKQMEEGTAALLATFPAELNIFQKHFAVHLQQLLRKVPARSAKEAGGSSLISSTCALADPGCFMPLSTFLHCFYCGTARPSFLASAIAVAEDADGSVNYMGPLSDLVFGQLGLDSFLAQLPALVELGCTDRDVALLTVTWIARQGGRYLRALWTTTTVGLLAATLLNFGDDDFLHALDRAPIPFVSVDGDVARAAAADSLTSLLWCCAVRAALQPCGTVAASQHFARRVRQLLQLWYTLTRSSTAGGAGDTARAEAAARSSERSCSGGTDGRIAFSLRLVSVEPPSLPLSTLPEPPTSSASLDFRGAGTQPSAVKRSTDSGCETAAETEGDTFEVYLQRNGISTSLLDDFAVPRGDADADAVRILPLFSTFVSSLGATEHVRSRGRGSTSDSPDVVEALPWIEAHQWDQDRFRNEVTRPLEKLWQQLCASAASGKSGATRSLTSALTLRGGSGGGVDRERRAAVYSSCLLLVAMSVLEHAMRPLTDVDFFFWDNNAVPDGNFFPVDGSPAGLVLSGSRTSRDYLQSLQRLAALVESMVQQAVTPLENADRVQLIQQISMTLSEDDALLFPLVPNFLRARLTVWMQVLAQAPHAPLRRVQRVGRLVSLLLFFSEASALTVGGTALTQLQSQMTVPWQDLIGGPNRRDQLRLLPDVFIVDGSPPAQPHAAGLALSAYAVEDENPNTAPLHPVVAAAVLRRFLVAAGVLYAQQHGQLMVTSAFPPAPCLGLIADDTRQNLARLARCLGLHEARPDIADVVLMDYEIKHLFPVSAIEQEMLLLSTKAAAPQIGFAVLQCFLVQVLQYVTTQRKTHERRGDRAAFEIISEQLHRLVDVLSLETRAWLQRRETEMQTAVVSSPTPADAPKAEGKKGTCLGSVTSAMPSVAELSEASPQQLLCDSSWVTVTEYQDMRRLVFSVLALPKGTPERKNFYQVLFTLAQWACEGRLTLPAPLQRIARELPVIVENWEKIA